MGTTITSRTTHAEIRRMLREDGYESLTDRAAEIKDAAGRRALLWTSERLTTTDASRIDARPRRFTSEDMDYAAGVEREAIAARR